MNGIQQQILKELIKEYFSGGNAARQGMYSPNLKEELNVIRDFVKENFGQ